MLVGVLGVVVSLASLTSGFSLLNPWLLLGLLLLADSVLRFMMLPRGRS